MSPSQAEVFDLVYEWFRRLTVKRPLEEMLEMLSPVDLEMKFPEKTLRGIPDFKEWYKTVTNLFFDQVHEIKELSVESKGDEAHVFLIVNWQARTWTPPAAFSEWQGFLIKQNWVVKRDAASQKAVIAKYAVGRLDPMNPIR